MRDSDMADDESSFLDNEEDMEEDDQEDGDADFDEAEDAEENLNDNEDADLMEEEETPSEEAPSSYLRRPRKGRRSWVYWRSRYYRLRRKWKQLRHKYGHLKRERVAIEQYMTHKLK